MATVTKNRNFFKWPKLLYFKPECAQIWTVSIMMIFLAYITGFFMNFELSRFWPIMQIRKKGGWNLKKIFSSETTEPISTNLCWNDSWNPGTIPARFGLIWFSGFRGEDLNVIFYQNMPNLHNRYISAVQNCVRWSWLPTKMATKLKIEKRWDEILIVHCCFSISQNELKF
jgi:hypothetical protein